MFEFDKETETFCFQPEDLKEVYEPLITQFGFEYEECLDSDKKGLVWTKAYSSCDDYLSVVMIIREGLWDFCPSPEKATFFSSSLWIQNDVHDQPGCILYSNPNEWEGYYEDEVDILLEAIPNARAKVNEVLEKCRVALSQKLVQIRDELRNGKTWEQIKSTLTYERLVPEELPYPKVNKTFSF
jgi:hypothetical protein